MTRTAHWFLLVLMIAGLGLLIMSCSDDDDGPTGPEGSDTGIIILVTLTNNPDVTGTWTLAGPDGLSQTGAGTVTLEEMPAGDYTVTWNDIEGWITPDVRTGSLGGGRTLTLSGTYDFIEPPVEVTITVDAEPDSINAPWALRLPDGSLQAGQGDQVLEDLSEGDYTMIWGDVVGYVTPDSVRVEGLDEDRTFIGTYALQPDPIGEFVTVTAGTFTMGDDGGDADEGPARSVTLTNDFTISETEITNLQFAELMLWAVDQGHATLDGDLLRDNLDGNTEVLFDLSQEGVEIILLEGGYTTLCAECPVIYAPWKAAAAYCDWLSLQEGLPRAYDHSTWLCGGGDPYSAEGYRLPTEAEWEYACRGGTTTDFCNADVSDPYSACGGTIALNDVGWFCGNASGRTSLVQRLDPNDFEIYDMHGNVWEWCNDWYDNSYDPTETTDPTGPAAAVGDYDRVTRGGSWYSEQAACRSANRYPYASPAWTGFRPVRTLP